MSRYADYSRADIKVVTLREAVLRRPGMYFGDYRQPDWPLVMAAWTAHEMLDYASPPPRQATVTLHGNGDLSVSVARARIEQPATAQRSPIDHIIRRRMWWHELARSATIAVGPDGPEAAEPEQVDDRLVWSDLDIEVRLELDAQLIGMAPELWWRDGLARLQHLFADPRFHLTADGQLVILHEATGTTLTVG